jgi:hypothetical protein
MFANFITHFCAGFSFLGGYKMGKAFKASPFAITNAVTNASLSCQRNDVLCHSLFPLITFCTTSLVVKRCSLAHMYLLYTSLFGRALVSSTLTHLAQTGHFT